ncbi:hypothetical protein BDV93DRAFT_517326 [Ceratobasidium sp. AG-I]|nr:hypothetical protein BDV93DRAFT_517326 [Ceratobasidium sp. AG-I]
MGPVDPLSGYRYQALPDLSGRRDPTHSRLSAVRSVNFGVDEQSAARHVGLGPQALARAAFTKVLLGYLDTTEFLFGEVSPDSKDRQTSSLSPVRPNLLEHKSWVTFARQLDEHARSNNPITASSARAALSLPGEVNPLPARFLCGSLQDLYPAYSEGLLLLGIPASISETSSLDLTVVCDSSIMSETALQNYLDQVCATFAHILVDPTASPYSAIPLAQNLRSSYEEEYDSSRAHVAVDWLTRNAATRPNAIAHEIYATLDDAPAVLTFAELNTQSNRLARWFLQHGIQIEDKVAVCRSRDRHFYVANAALFKSGACYVSIDPELPLERRQYIVRDSGTKFVITTANLAPDFGEAALVLEDADMEESLLKQSSEDICLAKLDSLAYLLYTSGTTGTPKGCLLNHRGLYWAIEAMCTYPRRVTQPDSDKRLALASIAFDVHISEICQAWCLGIRLVSAPRYEILADLQENLINLGITHAGMVPSMIEATLTGPDDLPLKYLVSGGEKISDSLLRKWANHPSLILANFYGPTEATIGCTSRLIKQTDRKENIGHPFPSCRAYVIDASMNIVPRGNPGELVVEGPLVGRGYHNLPEATAKAFKKWPTPDSNAYCTGDLVSMMPDDTIEIMGRIDTQIKLRGVRIESEGVSNVLRKASEQPLDVATLIAKHPDSGSELLVSFVALGDRQVSVAERRSGRVELAQDFPPSLMQSLKSMATRELAVYMRPSHIVPVAFLPLSLNMKTDNKMLAEFFRATPVSTLLAAQQERKPLEPSSATPNQQLTDPDQLSVATIVSRLSGTPLNTIQEDSNLFECGMDSIKLSALARELRKLWPGVQITVAEVLAAPVLSNVARLKQTSQKLESGISTSICDTFDQKWRSAAERLFRPEDIEAVLPTFPVQDGVLFQALVSPSRYVQHFVYRLKQDVQANDIQRVWAETIRQHQILRTAFVVEDTPLQVVLHPDAVDVPLSTHVRPANTDQSSFISWFHESEAARIAVEINEDLATPTLRINIYQFENAFMVVSLSHAIYDGIAVPNLMQTIDSVLSGECAPNHIPLQPLLDSIHLNLTSSQQFWTHKFSNIDLKALSVRRPARPQAQHLRQVLSSVSYEAVQSACRSQQTTLQALGCASFALAGRDCLGWHDTALFGIIRSGRSLPVEGAETAVAPLVSLVPFAAGMDGKSPLELLQDSQTELVSTSAFEHTPLGQIQRWLGVQSLFDIVFSCRVEEPREPYKSFKHCETKTPSPEFILAVEMLTNPISNVVEIKAAFTEELPAASMDFLVSRIESHLGSLCGGKSSAPIDDPRSGTDAPARSVDTTGNARQTSDKEVDVGLEKALITAVALFLKVPESLVAPNSSLVALGLTSLKSVALSRRLKSSSITVTAIDIIQADTVRGVASKCGRSSSSTSAAREGKSWLDSLHGEMKKELAATEFKLTDLDEPEIMCATALQSGMLSQTVSSSDRLYVHGFTFKLRPDSNIDKLKFAWRQTMQETSTLRTSFTFATELGRWVQVVHSEVELPWTSGTFIDPSTALSEFISTLPLTDVADFAQPPLRLCHFTTSEGDYLLVVLHHALYDGISLPLLFNRVRSIYHDISGPPPSSFHDLIPEILIQEHLGTPYWVKRLEGATPFMLPRALSGIEGAWRNSIQCEVSLDDIQRTCRRYQVNVQCLGQAAMAKVLSRVSGHQDVLFGQVISGRTLPGAETVIGPVFNTIPCRIDLSSARNYGDLLRGIQRANNESLSYQHASLRSIQRELGFKTLTDSLFLFQPDASATSNDLAPIWDPLERANKEETKTQYALNVELHQNPTGFVIRASCLASAMDQATLSETLSQLSNTLREIILHPTSTIREKSVPPPAAPASKPDATHTRELSDHQRGDATHTSEFEGWSSDQLKFKDILIAFTKVPTSNVHPSSQLASLGLDSISAIQLAGMAKRAGIKLAAADVAGSTTLADVAAIISKKAEHSSPQKAQQDAPARPLLNQETLDQARSALPDSLRGSVEDFLPTTPGMDFMLASWVRSGGWSFQHVFAFKISPGTDTPKLHRAWDALVEQHAILRSVFVNITGQNVLCVLKPGSIRTPWIELILDGEKPDLEEVGQHARQAVVDPPLLRGGPGSRVTYIHGQDSDYMVLNMHHALYDAWSFNILLRDLEDLYQGTALGSRNDLAYLSRAIASPDNVDKQRSYWRNAFEGFQPCVVESTASQAALDQLSGAGGQLLKHTEAPLLISLGALQVFSLVRHRLPRKARNFISGALTATSACLSALAIADLVKSLRPQPSITSIDSSQEPQTRVHGLFRDLVVGFGELQTRAAERNLPLHMVLLACWAKIQAKRSHTANQGVSFGLLHNGRGLDGIEEVAAPCINVLPLYVCDALDQDAFVVAEAIQTDLKLRSAVVEQSRLQDVGSWVGAPGKPLFNYFINMLRVPSATTGGKASAGILERIKIPADPSSSCVPGSSSFKGSSKPRFPTMPEVQHECMIEIFFDGKKDSVGMEVTCTSLVMTESGARELAETWADEVRSTFRE